MHDICQQIQGLLGAKLTVCQRKRPKELALSLEDLQFIFLMVCWDIWFEEEEIISIEQGYELCESQRHLAGSKGCHLGYTNAPNDHISVAVPQPIPR